MAVTTAFLPAKESVIPAFIIRVHVFIIPEVPHGNSTQDSIMAALIRRMVCGDFIKGFRAIGFTEDSGTTIFIPEYTPGFTRDSIHDFTANVSLRGVPGNRP